MHHDRTLLFVAHSYFVVYRITNQLFGAVLLRFVRPLYVARNAAVESAVGFTTMVSVKVKTEHLPTSRAILSRLHPLHSTLGPKGRLTCLALNSSHLTLPPFLLTLHCWGGVNFYGRPCCEIFMMRERRDFSVSGSSPSVHSLLRYIVGRQK